MRHFQKVTTVAAALALAFAVSSASAAGKKATPAPYDFEAEYAEYQKYFEDARRNSKDDAEFYAKIEEFDNSHPKCAVSKIDMAIGSLKRNSKEKAKSYFSSAYSLFKNLPKSDNGNDVKGYYYQAKAEMELFVNNNLDGFRKNKALCMKLSTTRGAELSYLAGRFYYDVANQINYTYIPPTSPNAANAIEAKLARVKAFYASSKNEFQIAFNLDKNLDLLSASDISTFSKLCSSNSFFTEYAQFFDLYFESTSTNYFNTLGAISTNVYEKSSKEIPNNIVKASLTSILDSEANENSESNELVATLEKRFAGYKECAPAIAFIKKFYSNENFTQADLDSLPEGVRDFMPVRYMYKMKTSNDVTALREEFGTFFGSVANYKARITAKK